MSQGMMSWKTRMEQRRTYEEDKKRSAAVAVNDISFPALGGGGGANGGWGEAAPAPAPAKTTTFADRLKQALAAAAETQPTEDHTAESPQIKFRHPQLGRRGGDFGTSRSSYEDTYYDEEPVRLLPMAGAGSDGGWRTVEKKMVKPQTKMFEPEDHVPDDEDFPEDDYQPDEDESYKDDWKNRL
jgi:hypothetical protein